MTWFLVSDNHFFHKNISKYCNRPFYSVEQMNQTMISNWNSVVSKDDLVIHLGDFALCTNNERLQELINQLNGRIWLITGNHDHPSRLSRMGIKVISSYMDKEAVRIYIDNLILTHRPLDEKEIPFNFVNVHGHIHNKGSYGRRINVSVDVTGFYPVPLNEIIKEAKELLK